VMLWMRSFIYWKWSSRFAEFTFVFASILIKYLQVSCVYFEIAKVNKLSVLQIGLTLVTLNVTGQRPATAYSPVFLRCVRCRVTTAQ
jgi:hypothetical protein